MEEPQFISAKDIGAVRIGTQLLYDKLICLCQEDEVVANQKRFENDIEALKKDIEKSVAMLTASAPTRVKEAGKKFTPKKKKRK